MSLGEAALGVEQLLPQACLTLKPTILKEGLGAVLELSEVGTAVPCFHGLGFLPACDATWQLPR